MFGEPPRYKDDWNSLEHLFQKRVDPWGFLRDPYERARLARLGEMVLRVPHESVLEVGCAEGAFTTWLTDVAKRVVALDVSATACERARDRAPRAAVVNASVDDLQPSSFDLVVCSEVVYYFVDPKAAIERMLTFAPRLLLTYTRSERARLDSLTASFKVADTHDFEYVVWRFPRRVRGCRMLIIERFQSAAMDPSLSMP